MPRSRAGRVSERSADGAVWKCQSAASLSVPSGAFMSGASGQILATFESRFIEGIEPSALCATSMRMPPTETCSAPEAGPARRCSHVGV